MMKNVKRLFALALIAVLTLSLFACKNNTTTAAALVDSSEAQQGWLKYPASNLVINPDKLNNSASSAQKQAFNFGIMDNDKVTASANDAYFFLESKDANNLNGEKRWEADFRNSNNWENLDDLKSNNSVGSALKADVDTEKMKKLKMNYPEDDSLIFDMDEKNMCLVVEVEQCPSAGFEVELRSEEAGMGKITAPGEYRFNIREILDRKLSSTIDVKYGEHELLFDITFSGTGNYSLKSFYLAELPNGWQYASDDVKSTWAPYSITTEEKYPNGTTLKAEDYFYNEKIINRKVTATADGYMGIAGKIDGTVQFDSAKNALLVTKSGINYVITSYRKGEILFYKTEQEMLAQLNGIKPEEDLSDAKYWVMDIGKVNKEVTEEEDKKEATVFYISLSASASDSADSLVADAVPASAKNNAENIYKGLEEFWDNYLTENKDASKYIAALK